MLFQPGQAGKGVESCDQLAVQLLENILEPPLHTLMHGVHQRFAETEIFHLGLPVSSG